MSSTLHAFFATCPRGLEQALRDELERCGAVAPDAVPGGVAFRGELDTGWRANLESRLATRVLLQVGRAAYRNEQQVYDAAYAVRWHDWFEPSRSIRVDVTASRSPLKSLEFITLRVKDAVCDRFRAERGRRPDVDTRSPEVRIAAFFDAREVTLYLDTSGEPLYKRGWRGEAGETPLKENLAAGLLALAGWRADEALVDPMCGAGTLLVEAAMIARRIAPGARRHFGFEKLSPYDAARWRGLREQVRSRELAAASAPIHGSDVSARQLALARANLAAAGLDRSVSLDKADVLDRRAPAPRGMLLANPPYGVRIGEQDQLAVFYPKLGDALKRNFAGWRCWLFSADPRLPRLIRLHASRRIPLFNGPLECRLYEYRIVEGSMRRGNAAG